MSFSAVLLAGGKSSRMGADKAGLLVDGVPLWNRQAKLLSDAGAGEIFISGKPDGPYAGSEFEIVEDDRKEAGPLSGLIVSLRRARFPLLLMLAVDMPVMTPDYLCGLFSLTGPTKGVVPLRLGIFEPLAAFYPRECLSLAESCRNLGQLSMQAFIKQAIESDLLLPVPIFDDEAPLFSNINTPADLEAFRLGKLL